MSRTVLLILLIALAILVPLSSRRPDAVQRVLGLSGGVDSLPKAALGIVVVAILAIALGKFLKRRGNITTR